MLDSSQPLTTETLQSLTPTVDMSVFLPYLIFGIVSTSLLTLIAIIYMVITSLRRYKVETATLEMHKDIKAIRELLEKRGDDDQSSSPTPIEPAGIDSTTKASPGA